MGEHFQKSELLTLFQFLRVRAAHQPNVYNKKCTFGYSNNFDDHLFQALVDYLNFLMTVIVTMEITMKVAITMAGIAAHPIMRVGMIIAANVNVSILIQLQ